MLHIKDRSLMEDVTISAAAYVEAGVRTLIFLDLDGVFIPDSYNTPPKGWFPLDRENNVFYPNRYYDKRINSRLPTHAREPKSFQFRWSTELIDKLKVVIADPTVLVVWVTTWREDMGGVVKFLGLNSAREMVYLPWGDGRRDVSHSEKIPAVDSFLNAAPLNLDSVKLVWAEDVALANMGSSDSIFRQFSEENVLLVKPTSSHGLSYSEWNDIVKFVES